jgi:hypothetical protein
MPPVRRRSMRLVQKSSQSTSNPGVTTVGVPVATTLRRADDLIQRNGVLNRSLVDDLRQSQGQVDRVEKVMRTYQRNAFAQQEEMLSFIC